MRGRTRRKLAGPRSLLETITALANSTCFLRRQAVRAVSARAPGAAWRLAIHRDWDEPFCPLVWYGRGSAPARRRGISSGRWNCHACKSSFNVLSKTMFQGTHLPLQQWFCAIALIVNAKKSLSSYQLGRDLNLNQRSAWYMQQRIRAEMATKQGKIMLRGLIESREAQ